MGDLTLSLNRLPSPKFERRPKTSQKWLFLSRVSILTRDIDIANLSVCLCVRNVPVSDENGLTYRHNFFQHTVAQSFCFYRHQTSSRNSDRVTPCGGAKYRLGIKKFCDFLPISRYIVQTMQDIAIVTMEGE